LKRPPSGENQIDKTAKLIKFFPPSFGKGQYARQEKNIMWKMCITAVALCLLTANATLAAEFKIGIVDMREIATNSEPAKKAKATMESKFGAEKAKLEKQNIELQKQREALKSPAANQTREAFEQKRTEYIRKQQEFDQRAREFTAKAEKEELQLRNGLLDLVFKVAKDFAVKKGLTYLVDANSGILYADDALVLSKDFLEEVNRQWKENPPASSSAPASAPTGGGKKK
jgi:Skp family chaperone for outer membrane proteins